MKKVILDTSALMDINEFKVDLLSLLAEEGYTEFLVPEAVVEELRKKKRNVNARVALMLLNKMRVVSGKGHADEVIVELAKKEGAAVCTTDRELIEKLKKEKINVIYLRQRKRLESC